MIPSPSEVRGPSAGARAAAAVRRQTRANNFDLLRLLAAAAVLISHGYVVTGRIAPMTTLTSRSLGHYAVLVFFAMSGFLVTKSWRSEPRLRAFVAKRALRLAPALLATLLLSAFVLGPIFTTDSVGTYFTGSGPYQYVAHNAVLRANYQSLPGVFETNPFGDSINGSLWTLRWEVVAYVGVLLLGMLGLLRWRWALLVGLVVAMVAGAARPVDVAFWLAAAFAVGSILYLFRERGWLRGWVALMLLGAWAVAWRTRFTEPLAVAAMGYTAVYVALRPPFGVTRWLQRTVGDPSYGLYLWAFPVEQAVVHLSGPSVKPLVVIGLALPITGIIAVLSWRFVESPALQLKPRFANVATRLPESSAKLDRAATDSDAHGKLSDPSHRHGRRGVALGVAAGGQPAAETEPAQAN